MNLERILWSSHADNIFMTNCNNISLKNFAVKSNLIKEKG